MTAGGESAVGLMGDVDATIGGSECFGFGSIGDGNGTHTAIRRVEHLTIEPKQWSCRFCYRYSDGIGGARSIACSRNR